MLKRTIYLIMFISLSSIVFASTYETHGYADDAGASVSETYGAEFRTNSTNISIEKVGIYATCTGTRARIYTTGDSLIATSTSIDSVKNFTFTPAVALAQNTSYYVTVDGNGGSYIYRRATGGTKITGNITWIDGVYGVPHAMHGGYFGNVKSITYSETNMDFRQINNITLLNPTNNSLAINKYTSFAYNFTGYRNASVSLFINNLLNETKTNQLPNITNYFNKYFINEGRYNWTINISDSSGTTSTQTNIFNIDENPWEVNGTIIVKYGALIVRQCR